jgi:flavin-dependent dehydrogenase
MKQWDVVIIGAGVAGSSAAQMLAGEYSTLLIDPKPFSKTCAGILTADYTRRYRVDASCIERRLKGVKIYYRHSEVIIPYTENELEYSINRQLFDLQNLRCAIQSGAEYRAWKADGLAEDSERVKIKTSGGLIQCRYALIACGVSRLSQQIAPVRALGYCVQKKIENVVDDYFQMHFGYHRGYTWLSPKSTYSLVGTGSPEGYQPIPLYQNHRSPITLGVIPYSGPVNTTASRRTALIGDAAGFVTPFEGEGIYYARRSAELAAETLLEQGSNATMRGFERKWRQEFSFTPYWLHSFPESPHTLKALVEELERNEGLRGFAEALLTKKNLKKIDYLRVLPALLKILIKSAGGRVCREEC